MIIPIPKNDRAIVTKVSVQVSLYSKQNGGSDDDTVFAVEVLFPDGTWKIVETFEQLDAANAFAKSEAHSRGADLLPESRWPNRKV